MANESQIEKELTAISEAENRIAEADAEKDWEARYRHLVQAHRQQAKRAVEVERERNAAQTELDGCDRMLANERALAAEQRAAAEGKLERTLQAYDELYLQLTGSQRLLGLVLSTVPGHTVRVMAGESGRWEPVWWDEGDGRLVVRGIQVHYPPPSTQSDD